jgi:hypothetical protein
MSSTPVQRDQFEVSPKGITHQPTGATYIPTPAPPIRETSILVSLETCCRMAKIIAPMRSRR